MMEIYIAIAILAFMAMGVTWAWRREIKAWNNGKCRKCEYRLARFDTDSQGGRMYKCGNPHGAHYGPDISYPWVDASYDS